MTVSDILTALGMEFGEGYNELFKETIQEGLYE